MVSLRRRGRELLQKAMLGMFHSLHTQNRTRLVSLLEDVKADRVLDCGCGDGSLTAEIGAQLGTKHLYGVEVAPTPLKEAEQKGIQVYLADLNQKLPIDDESFDLVVANQVIEHLCNTDTFVTEVYRILRRGGGGSDFN